MVQVTYDSEELTLTKECHRNMVSNLSTSDCHRMVKSSLALHRNPCMLITTETGKNRLKQSGLVYLRINATTEFILAWNFGNNKHRHQTCMYCDFFYTESTRVKTLVNE